MSEQDLVKACLQYLTMKRIFHWRNNTGALKTEKGGFVRYGAVGSPDIFILHNGKLIGVECKFNRNKQSTAQKEWESAMKKNGGEYYVIYSIEELVGKFS